VIILDTHVIVWFTERNRQLGQTASRLIIQGLEQNLIALSAASTFELGWLEQRGRLNLPADLDAYLAAVAKLGVRTIPVSARAALLGARASLPHGDPVDRMIVGLALAEGARLMTGDSDIVGSLPPANLIDARL
jgi:PIN domain nuclease of toxin-antitoxin system